MPPTETFKGLDAADRKVLADWLVRANERGIDRAIDLSVRPWNVAGHPVVVGVFETDKPLASWLAVRLGIDWTLARCADGFVSDASASLLEILDLIDADANP